MDSKSNNILLAFYGDDFTGSTDALEFLARAGAKTALFIEPPTPEQLKKYPGLNAFGVAGKTRAMAPALRASWCRSTASWSQALLPEPG